MSILPFVCEERIVLNINRGNSVVYVLLLFLLVNNIQAQSDSRPGIESIWQKIVASPYSSPILKGSRLMIDKSDLDNDLAIIKED